MDAEYMDKQSSRFKKFLNASIEFILRDGLILATGAALGAVISLAMSYEDATSFWSMIGAMLAGLGTVGLLAFGWITAQDWLKQSKENKRLELAVESTLKLLPLAEKASSNIYAYFQKLNINTDYSTAATNPLKSTSNPQKPKPTDPLPQHKIDLINQIINETYDLYFLISEFEYLETIIEGYYQLVNIKSPKIMTEELASSIHTTIWNEEIKNLGDYKEFKDCVENRVSCVVGSARNTQRKLLKQLLNSHSSL